MNLEDLKAPFENVKQRQGPGGKMLDYITARQVMDRLDEVVGPLNWQNRYHEVKGVTVCDIGIRDEDGQWIWKSDGSDESDIEAEKGALSGAFKRAAVHLGVGRYLYGDDVKAPQNASKAPSGASPQASSGPASEKQVAFLAKLAASSVLSAEEKDAVDIEIKAGLGKKRASALIEATKKLIDSRKGHEVDQGPPNPPPPEEAPPLTDDDQLPF